MAPPRATARKPRTGDPEVVRLPVRRDDRELVEGLREGEHWAQAALFDRYASQVQRILLRLIGGDADLDVSDLIHDTFIQAFRCIDSLEEPAALERWLQVIATRTAYRAIRHKQRRRWLRQWAPEPARLPEKVDMDTELLEAYRRTRAVLEGMPARYRVPFSLRFVEGFELKEIAEACECSVATVKRRLSDARERFVRAARRDDLLRGWLEGGSRWSE